jgi:siroheme synthase (precorrin-2 oxidase/ferrochelatase)
MKIEERLQEYLKKIDQIIDSYEGNVAKVFTIGNTRISNESRLYFTPIRKHEHVISAGVIVFSEEEAAIIMSKVDGLFDAILVDSEKKSISANVTHGIFNLERLSSELIKKTKIFRFKGNDLTTNSIEDFVHNVLLRKGKLMGGRNVLIIGLGNLGFKVALRLVELGMNIYVKNRTASKVDNLVKAINLVKPKETIASVQKFSDFDKSSVLPKIDFVILCTTGVVSNFEEYIDHFGRDITILDVGKGCISNEVIECLKNRSIVVYRLDIGEELGQFIFGKVLNKRQTEIPRFRQLLSGNTLLTKGIVGLEGDIVVDDIDNPRVLYGVCDGKGTFFSLTKAKEQEILNLIQRKN